ncbi:hypothetical protein BCONGLO52_16050 [Brachybacterium conglomeratum]|uniref:Uncharacterized protein n=1 Tax=Brachybacterium conglomeratum TaxID=47846 RepID=A0ABQ5RGQ7_9MICO|nr:hypothetical protein BCONGLO52_16050 [Brachybacterium conglomeratum]GLK05278.1 hypothetical protein GCM10017597_20780 [Brachybacterium conglomeratum]
MLHEADGDEEDDDQQVADEGTQGTEHPARVLGRAGELPQGRAREDRRGDAGRDDDEPRHVGAGPGAATRTGGTCPRDANYDECHVRLARPDP